MMLTEANHGVKHRKIMTNIGLNPCKNEKTGLVTKQKRLLVSQLKETGKEQKHKSSR